MSNPARTKVPESDCALCEHHLIYHGPDGCTCGECECRAFGIATASPSAEQVFVEFVRAEPVEAVNDQD